MTVRKHIAVTQKRGRPQIDPQVRLRIVTLHAYGETKRGKRFTLDGILDQLVREGVEQPPSRSTVAATCKWWDDLTEGRDNERPFEWRHLEKAKIPWEAGEWVLLCKRTLTDTILTILNQENALAKEQGAKVGGDLRPLITTFVRTTFTNRLAKWCWRVHLANRPLQTPDERVWSPYIVTAFAAKYAQEEFLHDFFNQEAEDSLEGVLTYRPDLDAKSYLTAVYLGVVAPWRENELDEIVKPTPDSPIPTNEYVVRYFRHFFQTVRGGILSTWIKDEMKQQQEDW